MSVDPFYRWRLSPAQPGPPKKPGGGTVFIRVNPKEQTVTEPQYAGVRVELDNGKIVDHSHAVSWDSDAHSLIVNSNDCALAEYVAGSWLSVSMIAESNDDDNSDGNGLSTEEWRARVSKLEEMLDRAWGIIANVDDGNGMGVGTGISNQHTDWIKASCDFRETYFKHINGSQRLRDESVDDEPVSDAEPHAMLKAYQECRAHAQELLEPLSENANWADLRMDSNWRIKRSLWMRQWAT